MMDLKSGLPWESLYITTLSRDRDLLMDILEDARSKALEKEIGKIVIFTSYGPEWRPFGNPRVRRLIF
jgi:chaperone BCS1